MLIQICRRSGLCATFSAAHIDGEPLRSCLTARRHARGWAITAIEGISSTPIDPGSAKSLARSRGSPVWILPTRPGHVGGGLPDEDIQAGRLTSMQRWPEISVAAA